MGWVLPSFLIPSFLHSGHLDPWPVLGVCSLWAWGCSHEIKVLTFWGPPNWKSGCATSCQDCSRPPRVDSLSQTLWNCTVFSGSFHNSSFRILTFISVTDWDSSFYLPDWCCPSSARALKSLKVLKNKWGHAQHDSSVWSLLSLRAGGSLAECDTLYSGVLFSPAL